MELRVLGALEIWHDGTPAFLRAAKPRQLLTILATRPAEPVPANVLIDDLWEGDAPATAASALRVHVTQVRRVLEPDRPSGPSARLPLSPSGYVLRISRDELDWQCFESLVLAGSEANRLGDPQGAESDLAQALALWRGAPLFDAQGLSAVAAQAAHLEALRVRAIEQLAEARLALGQHAALVDSLLDAADEFPLHENFAAQLMLALYRSGRQAEALRVFGHLARELDQQLGIKPSTRLRQLEEDVLLQRSHLEYSPRGPDQCGPTPFRDPGPRLVGRREELRLLLEAEDAAADGDRRCVLVSGPAGIGKTTLATAFATRARSLGASVFAGACLADRAGSYEAVTEILASVGRRIDEGHAPETDFASESGEHTPPETLVDRDLESAQLRLFEAIATRLRGAGDRSVVLILEDLHWASITTLLVLRYLLRLSDIDNLLVVASVRDDELDSERAGVIAEIASSSRTRRLALEGLNDHEVRALIRAANSREAFIDLGPDIRDATDGNPFFIRALLRDLDDHASEDRSELEARVAAAAPTGVRALIDRRIANISSGARDVLESAAILGAEFSVEILGDLCELSRDATLEAIDELLGGRLLVEDPASVDRFAFPHALVRNAVYLGIVETHRRDLHRRAGETLEARGAESPSYRSARIAYHFREAVDDGGDGAANAAVWAERAAAEMAQRSAFAEAAEWYEQVLQLRTDTDAGTNGGTYLALGLACEGARQFDRARAAYAAAAVCARLTRDGRLLADIAMAAAPAWTSALVAHPHLQRLIEDALDQLESVDPQRRIQLLARLATLMYYVDPERQRCLVNEARELARQDVGGSAVAVALLAEHLCLTRDPSARCARLAMAQQALAAAGSIAVTQLRVGRELLTDLLENGDIDGFDRELDAYESRAKAAASARDIYWAMALRATQATLRGEMSMAEQLARGALLRGRELYQDAGGAEFLQRFVLRYQQGRLSEFVGALRQGTKAQPGYHAGSTLAALACAETGELEVSSRIARWAVGADGTGIQKDVLWTGAHALLCGVAARAGDVELARILDDLVAPCTGHIVIFGAGGAVLGPMHYWRGIVAATLSELDRAVDHLEEAVRMSEEIRAPFWSAQSQVDLARALVRRGRSSSSAAARELAERALAASRQRGFGRIVSQAQTLL